MTARSPASPTPGSPVAPTFLRSRRPAIAMWVAIVLTVFGGSAVRALRRPAPTAALPGRELDVDRGGGDVGAHRQGDHPGPTAAS